MGAARRPAEYQEEEEEEEEDMIYTEVRLARVQPVVLQSASVNV
jgi:hypothetical protein